MSIYENHKDNIWPNIDDQYFSNFITDVINPLLINLGMDSPQTL